MCEPRNPSATLQSRTDDPVQKLNERPKTDYDQSGNPDGSNKKTEDEKRVDACPRKKKEISTKNA